MTARFKPRGLLDQTYEVGIILKGLNGLAEIAGAALLFFASPRAVNSVVAFLTQHELSEDPNDFIATHLAAAAHQLAIGGNTFAVLYLLSHGLVKIIIVAGLLMNRPWAYPLSLGTLGLFVLYQVYRIILQPTVGMVALTIFDLAIIWLIWREYDKQVLKPKRAMVDDAH